MGSEAKQSGRRKQKELPAVSFDLERISEDITALRTALEMQASLLNDIEQTLKLPAREPLIPGE